MYQRKDQILSGILCGERGPFLVANSGILFVAIFGILYFTIHSMKANFVSNEETTNELINKSSYVNEIIGMLNYMDLLYLEQKNTYSGQITIHVNEEQIALPITKDTYDAIYEALFSLKIRLKE